MIDFTYRVPAVNAVASSAHVDGLRAGEVESEFPCDRHIADPEDAYFRAIDASGAASSSRPPSTTPAAGSSPRCVAACFPAPTCS
jgi:hypothetical protein